MATRSDSPLAFLRFALADPRAREAFRLSQRKLAAEIGISPRSLMRYLRGERRMPEQIGLRLLVKAQDIESDVRRLLDTRARTDDVVQPKDVPVPVAAHRYVPPPSPVTGIVRSEIVMVDTAGLTNAEVAEIVKSYWRTLSKSDTDWNIRFLVKVNVEEYFEGEQPENREIAKAVKNKKHAFFWIPPQHFAFVRARRRDVGSIVQFRRADQVLRYLNEYLASNYAGRLPDDFIFHKIAFIPYRTGSHGKRYQKRKGKR